MIRILEKLIFSIRGVENIFYNGFSTFTLSFDECITGLTSIKEKIESLGYKARCFEDTFSSSMN